MRRIYSHTFAKESQEDMFAAGRFNPCMEITFQDRNGKHTHKLSSGTGDVIHVYREAGETFVLSVNDPLGYVGLEVFDGRYRVTEVFLQGDQVKEVLGRDDLAPFTIIRRLLNRIA
ncbi:MAG: hypothetical protein JEZ11_20950 [Desulfobacterales bacterium]|nr:hypothetical protein [Desulfobacterales bacterium]